MMELTELKEKLKSYKKEDIIFTEHSELQAFTRDVDFTKTKKNMIVTLLIQNTFIIGML